MKRKFIVTGYKPFISKQHNDLLKCFDLGIEGSFTPFADNVTLTLEENVDEEQLERQPGALKAAYKNLGCADIIVREVPNA